MCVTLVRDSGCTSYHGGGYHSIQKVWLQRFVKVIKIDAV